MSIAKNRVMSTVKSSFDFSKDTIAKNLINHVRDHRIPLAGYDLEKVINLVNLSVEEAFQKTSKVIEDEIDRLSLPVKTSKKK